MNEVYQKALKAYNKTNWLNDPFGVFIEFHLEHTFGTRFNEEVESVFKEMFPRRKNIDLSRVPDEVVKPIKEKWQKRALSYLKKKRRQRDLLRDWLNKNSKNVEFPKKDPMQLVHTVSASTYSTQTNTYGYTRGKAKEKADRLEKFGFVTELKEVKWSDVLDDPHKPNGLYAFEVWANCPPYMLDVCSRLDNETILEWAVKQWGRGMNPKVDFPWLSDEIFEESMAIHMGRKQRYST